MNIPRLGITLTKHTILHPIETGFISMTWNDILQVLQRFIDSEKNNGCDLAIAEEYIDFLTGVGKEMNFFEVEVLSVAAERMR